MRSIHSDERGATAAEYALIASLIAAFIVAVVAVMGGEILGLFQSMVDVWP